jgi:hypothetical protein
VSEVLPDGSYDAFVVDAHDEGDVRHLELAIVTGPHKGEVVSVTSTDLSRADVDVMGLPAELVVRDGTPAIVIEG